MMGPNARWQFVLFYTVPARAALDEGVIGVGCEAGRPAHPSSGQPRPAHGVPQRRRRLPLAPQLFPQVKRPLRSSVPFGNQRVVGMRA
jgi:hypothetical protein